MPKRKVASLIIKVIRNGQKNRRFLKNIDRLRWMLCLCWTSFSQNFEDIYVLKTFERGGIYVDIGAHHPIRYSNTYLLYLNGWSGINIDPQIGVKEMFDEYRPDDINLGIGIGRCEQDVVFYNFEDPAFNTTNSERGDEVIERGLSKLVEKRRIKVYPLSSILDKYMDHGSPIDFMNIDVEKSELDVLQSNDWSKYRPKIIALEVLGVDGEAMEVVMSDKSIVFLRNQGYEPVGRVGWEVFLKDMKNTMAIDE